MPPRQPIKRSAQLAPLSRDHHDGLLFAWKIRQGIVNGTNTDNLHRYVNWYWNNFLSHHFAEEETLLLPQLASDNELSRRLSDEHNRIRELVKRSTDKESLAALADLVTEHIRFEERQYFPYLEQSLGEQALDRIFQQLETQSQCPEKWTEEFWIKK